MANMTAGIYQYKDGLFYTDGILITCSPEKLLKEGAQGYDYNIIKKWKNCNVSSVKEFLKGSPLHENSKLISAGPPSLIGAFSETHPEYFL